MYANILRNLVTTYRAQGFELIIIHGYVRHFMTGPTVRGVQIQAKTDLGFVLFTSVCYEKNGIKLDGKRCSPQIIVATGFGFIFPFLRTSFPGEPTPEEGVAAPLANAEESNVTPGFEEITFVRRNRRSQMSGLDRISDNSKIADWPIKICRNRERWKGHPGDRVCSPVLTQPKHSWWPSESLSPSLEPLWEQMKWKLVEHTEIDFFLRNFSFLCFSSFPSLSLSLSLGEWTLAEQVLLLPLSSFLEREREIIRRKSGSRQSSQAHYRSSKSCIDSTFWTETTHQYD